MLGPRSGHQKGGKGHEPKGHEPDAADDIDEDSFRSDLERDTIHSPSHPAARPGSGSRRNPAGLSHQERYAQLQIQSQGRSISAKKAGRRHLPPPPSSSLEAPPSRNLDHRPPPQFSNLFGLIDTKKLESICGLSSPESRRDISGHSLTPFDPIPQEASATRERSNIHPYITHGKSRSIPIDRFRLDQSPPSPFPSYTVGKSFLKRNRSILSLLSFRPLDN